MGKTVLFGRYRLLETAGSGGSAEVWRAIDERTGDEVALKRLHPIVFASEAGRRRLRREFRALEGLHHPSIVRVRDLELGRNDGAIVLDYVDGRSLADRLAHGPVPTIEEAVAIASDVAAALGVAHAAGIVHRDVTPGNILLDGDGPARLTDFGIARSDADETVATGTGQLVGTLRYIAPEQLRGAPATPASDLFALGAVTYEMLTGRPAFAATTPVALVEEQRQIPPPIERAPIEIDSAVRTALSPEPAARQPSVEAFAAQLRAGIGLTGEAATVGHGDAPIGLVPGAVGIAGLWAGASPAPADQPGVATRRRTIARRRVRHATAPLLGLVALAFGALVVAALAPWDEANTQAAAPTPAVTAEPTASPTGNEGRGNGRGKDKDKDKDHGGGGEGDD